jgi:microcystin-dependent protein
MGSSLILQGGAAVAKTLKESITQASHGFAVGDVIRWDGTAATPKYVKAIADTAQNAEVAGVVSQTPDSNEFEITYHGYIDLPSLSGISAPVMFLSSTSGGSMAASPPSAVGTVVKPVLTKNSNGSGYLVMNYLGTQIGGSSTIAVDEIQPVGTIMPYAGTVIPDTWLACDGASYAMSAYPELHEKVCYTTGDRAPMYGHIVEIAPSSGTIAATEWTASAVGDYIYIKNRTGSAGGGTPDVNTEASYDFVGQIIAKGTMIHSPTAQGWTVRILGKYFSATKRFEMPNAFVLPLSGSFASSVRVYSGVASGARGNGGSINTTSVVAFTVPDLRGRFPFGQIATAGSVIPDPDANTLSTILYDYPMASWGGEERHALTTAEMPAHKHDITNANSAVQRAFQADGNISGTQPAKAFAYADQGATPIVSTGGDLAHNNMPPYLAVRYIIKAKPYTRAAIIDGIDLPYNSLLVRDLRTRNVGGSNGDLVFLTNTSGDSGSGTERMRLTRNGLKIVQDDGYTLGIELIGAGSNPGTATPTATAPYLKFYNPETTQNRYTWWSPRDNYALAIEVSHDSLGAGSAPYSSGGQGITGCFYITQFGDVGVMKNSPGATLDVNGTLRVGDFGGSTNVMAKLNNNISSSNGDIGCAVPLLAWAGTGTTTPLPAGTWFVYLNAFENGTGDEDLCFVMAKVWTVTSGNWLRFKAINAIQTTALSRVQYSLGSNSTTTESAGTWVDFSTTNTNTYYGSGGVAVSTMFGTGSAGIHSGNVFLQGNSAVESLGGYAIRIA